MYKANLLVVDTDIPKNFRGLILFMVRPYWRRTALFFGLTLLAVASWAAIPFVVRTLINSLSNEGRVEPVAWYLVGLFLLLRLTDEWLWRIAEINMRKIKPLMTEGIRASMFAAMLKKPHAYFVNNSSGRVGFWINQVANTMNVFMDTTIWSVWPQSMGLVMSAFFLLFTHWSLALLFFVWLIGLFTYTVKRGKRYSKLIEKKTNADSRAAGRIVDSIANNTSVRIFNGRAQEVDSLKKLQDRSLYYWNKEWGFHLITNIVKGHSVAFVGAIALSLMLFLFSKGIITVGDVVLFIAYFTSASSSLWELSWQMDQYYNQSGAVNNALSKLLTNHDERVEDIEIQEEPATVSITLSNLSFAYPEQSNEYVLNKLNLTIESGQKVGVVGHSGAGKSTLVGLLLNFYEPTDGKITINNLDLSKQDPSFVRSVSSFVPQDTNLFNRTVRENIVYARPKATDDEIYAALEQAQALDFVNNLPDGLDTLVGERGVKLSGGQRQRIAIARAILKDSPFLILDEATSALDSVSEQAIQKALYELMQGRTALVIAHRLSTLKHLDKIVVVEKGRIVEEGTHDELVVRKNGVYADLWRRQKDGFIVE